MYVLLVLFSIVAALIVVLAMEAVATTERAAPRIPARERARLARRQAAVRMRRKAVPSQRRPAVPAFAEDLSGDPDLGAVLALLAA